MNPQSVRGSADRRSASAPALTEADLRALIERLAAIDRPSASPGERRAAELIAADLDQAGAHARLEDEDAHGGYWWPVGLPAALSALVARRGRLLATLVGMLGAAAVVDDITGGNQLLRRRLLPRRRTTNVVAELGPADAERNVLVVAHHDAAHSGLVFHPELPRAALRRFPGLLERADTTPGTMWGAVAGPALVGVGALLGLRSARALGRVVCAAYAAAMADIGLRGAVPGANDNLTGVAVLASLARSLLDEPLPAGLRVILLSTGSEEAFMEGMQAFARRHFGSLPPERTHVICVDTVGSPRLVALEGEGMVWMNEYPKDFLALVQEEAARLGIELVPNLRLRNATDGLVALRRGYPTAVFGSVDYLKIPTNYHWPTDTPDNVDYGTVADCARLCDAVVRRLPTASRRGESSGRA
ncbi:MAG: M28 family peptidase [Actinomycetota bacterium]|nr:M28 family peptidase [Actinomycetota bacterium]